MGAQDENGMSMNRYANLRFLNTSINTNNWTVTSGAGNKLIQAFNNAKTDRPLAISSDATSDYIASMRIYDRTYSATANVHVTSLGTLGRTTSASKYKLEIQKEEDYDYSKLLKISHSSWFDKANTERFNYFKKEIEKLELENLSQEVKKDRIKQISEEFGDIQALERVHGLIAEDLAEAGLKEFVVYNDITGEIEGIQYDRLTVPLIELAKEQNNKIEELEEKIDILMNKVFGESQV